MSVKPKLSPSAFAERAAEYFADCDSPYSSSACLKCTLEKGGEDCAGCKRAKTRPYTLSGLCLALGITKRHFSSLAASKTFRDEVEMAMLKIETFIEEGGFSGEINGTLALADLKENFGWGKETAAPKIEVVLDENAKHFAR